MNMCILLSFDRAVSVTRLVHVPTLLLQPWQPRRWVFSNADCAESPFFGLELGRGCGNAGICIVQREVVPTEYKDGDKKLTIWRDGYVRLLQAISSQPILIPN
jgi:hypothetical protein